VLPATPEDGLRIAFLCGCLEAGRDGVGDYTAQLAGECARRGNATLCIALNDLPTAGSVASDGMLRLGSGRPWDVRVEQAREAVEQFRADAVSLQWVPYGFDKRGMPWGIEKGLAAIMRGRVSHVMCHEIWIGAEMGASLKHRLIGAAQREVMRHLFTALRPGCVQTSNGVYGELLKRAGIEAGELPMFGAIPVTGFEGEPEEDVARFGMFGTLHPQWAPEPLLERLRGLGKRIEIEHIGRIGSGEAIWRAMEERYGREIGFKRHGEQPAERVSQFLMSVDFGIATTPLALIGKSATAAAMLEHGLPVIVNRDDVRYAGIATEKPEGVIAMDGDLVEALRTARKRQPQRRLEAAADQFLQCLRRTR
jgi:glycosyltransferase involved in cell wall biosynthesis